MVKKHEKDIAVQFFQKILSQICDFFVNTKKKQHIFNRCLANYSKDSWVQ